MIMELQKIIADFLMTAIIILSAGVVLYPLTLATMFGADEWLARHGIHGRRDLWRKLANWNRRVFAGEPNVLAVARIPAQDGSERRRYKRLTTRFLGTLHPNAKSPAANLCDVVDISASGVRIRPVDPLPEVPLVTLGLERFGLFTAQVVWRDGDEVGLRFLQSPAEIAHGMRGLVPAPCREPAPIARAA